MFEIVAAGFASYGVATKVVSLIKMGLDVMSILSIIAGIFGGLGGLSVLVIEMIKRKLYKEGSKAVIAW